MVGSADQVNNAENACDSRCKDVSAYSVLDLVQLLYCTLVHTAVSTQFHVAVSSGGASSCMVHADMSWLQDK